eukprot:jgi/Chrpa1/24714/Chrysochromulina_OHIO_Genome00024673-RA
MLHSSQDPGDAAKAAGQEKVKAAAAAAKVAAEKAAAAQAAAQAARAKAAMMRSASVAAGVPAAPAAQQAHADKVAIETAWDPHKPGFYFLTRAAVLDLSATQLQRMQEMRDSKLLVKVLIDL